MVCPVFVLGTEHHLQRALQSTETDSTRDQSEWEYNEDERKVTAARTRTLKLAVGSRDRKQISGAE